MPRTARPWEPDSYYHVDVRAHSGAWIFERPADREFVVERATVVFRELGVSCLAWAVLANHYHLLVRSAGPPGRAILRLNTSIAGRVRRSRGGSGAVFQGRFFSAVCTDDAAVASRLAYVTANPIHHRSVPSLDALTDHRWSSLAEVLGTGSTALCDVDALCAWMDAPTDRKYARRVLLELLAARIARWRTRDSDGATEWREDEPPEPALVVPRRVATAIPVPRTIGAVAGPVRSDPEDWELAEVRRFALRGEGWTPARLLGPACEITGADPGRVRDGRRTAAESLARAIVVHVAYRVVGWELLEVARTVGVSSSPAMRSAARGAIALATAGISPLELLARSRART